MSLNEDRDLSQPRHFCHAMKIKLKPLILVVRKGLESWAPVKSVSAHNLLNFIPHLSPKIPSNPLESPRIPSNPRFGTGVAGETDSHLSSNDQISVLARTRSEPALDPSRPSRPAVFELPRPCDFTDYRAGGLLNGSQ
jgi:hypothetical protein